MVESTLGLRVRFLYFDVEVFASFSRKCYVLPCLFIKGTYFGLLYCFLNTVLMSFFRYRKIDTYIRTRP